MSVTLVSPLVASAYRPYTLYGTKASQMYIGIKKKIIIIYSPCVVPFYILFIFLKTKTLLNFKTVRSYIGNRNINKNYYYLLLYRI